MDTLQAKDLRRYILVQQAVVRNLGQPRTAHSNPILVSLLADGVDGLNLEILDATG